MLWEQGSSRWGSPLTSHKMAKILRTVNETCLLLGSKPAVFCHSVALQTGRLGQILEFAQGAKCLVPSLEGVNCPFRGVWGGVGEVETNICLSQNFKWKSPARVERVNEYHHMVVDGTCLSCDYYCYHTAAVWLSRRWLQRAIPLACQIRLRAVSCAQVRQSCWTRHCNCEEGASWRSMEELHKNGNCCLICCFNSFLCKAGLQEHSSSNVWTI